ncbi:MAG: endonuclease/exonuclease/phosphatase family protein [Myxococcota bacterium]
MRNACISFLLLSLACSPTPQSNDADAGTNEPPDAGGNTGPLVVTMATWNTHLFWDKTCNSGNCDPDDFEQVLSSSEFEAKADEVADGIRGLEADVVTLQEIESQECLDALKTRLPEYTVAVLGELGTDASVDTAVMAKGTLMATHSHKDQTLYREDGSSTRFSREFLEVHVGLEGHRVIVFSAHFRSKANDDPGRRLAEAKAAKQIMTAVANTYPDATVLMGGDLNDVPGSPPIDALEEGDALLRVASELPGDDDATYTFQGTPEAIDHIFAVTSSRGQYVSGTVEVMKEGTVRRWAGSDHAAVRAQFSLTPQ